MRVGYEVEDEGSVPLQRVDVLPERGCDIGSLWYRGDRWLMTGPAFRVGDEPIVIEPGKGIVVEIIAPLDGLPATVTVSRKR